MNIFLVAVNLGELRAECSMELSIKFPFN
jgi:hypothetical protein